MINQVFNEDSSAYKVVDVVSAIRKWAIKKRLQEKLPDNIEEKFDQGNLNIDNDIDMESEAILKQRGIVFISYNELNREINIYTKSSVLKREKKVLPPYIKGCSIKYSKGNIDSIGSSIETAEANPYGNSEEAGVYFCGSSISLGNEASAGTLGCLVRNSEGKMFGLTNNHVSGACSHAQPGMPIVAPGLLDVVAGGLDPFTLGHHKKVLEYFTGTGGNVDITKNSDAAIFSIKDEKKVSSSQGGVFDTPKSVVYPTPGMVVEKFGRTTGHTHGVIDGIAHGPLPVYAQSAANSFSACVFFCDVFVVSGKFEHFSDSGDSGSLVVHVDNEGNRHAIGLIFAGGPSQDEPGKKLSFMLPLKPILERLQVEIVNEHNVAS